MILSYYSKSGKFHCKNIFVVDGGSQWWLRKLILQKCMRTINVNVVRGHSYEIFQHKNLSYESFITQKFPDLWNYLIQNNQHRLISIQEWYS